MLAQTQTHVEASTASTNTHTTTTSTSTPSSLLARYLLVSAAVISGALSAIQGSVNASLGQLAGYGTLATLISFSSGLLLLTFIVSIEAKVFAAAGPLLRWKTRPTLQLLIPGLLGVAYVTASIFLTLIIGFSLFWVCVVAGQLLGAVIADMNGWGVANGARLSISKARAAALTLAAGGVALAMVEQIRNSGSSSASFSSGIIFGTCIASFFAGVGMLAQSVLNRFAATQLPSRLQATWWSFFNGSIFAAFLTGIHMAAATPNHIDSVAPAIARATGEQLSGGVIGVVYIAASIYIPAILGSQTYAIALVSGQMIMSLTIDSLGLFGAHAVQTGSLKAVGIAVVLIAAVLSQLATKNKIPEASAIK